MWAMISLSVFVFIEDFHLKILLLILGVIGMASIIWIVPNEK
jgi:hypothetical protein